MTYTYDFYVTYHLFTDEEEQKIMYQAQFYQAFNGLNTENNKKTLDELYADLNTLTKFVECLNIISVNQGISHNEAFVLLFSIDFFYIMHTLLVNRKYKTQKDCDEKLDELLNKINSIYNNGVNQK